MEKKIYGVILILLVLGGIFYFSKSEKRMPEPVTDNAVKQSNEVIEPAQAENQKREATLQPEQVDTNSEEENETNRKEEPQADVKPTQDDPDSKQAKIQWKDIMDKETGLRFRLPYYFIKNGKTIKAFGRQNELLNVESRYTDTLGGNELIFKVYPQDHAQSIYEYQAKQFENKSGFFKQSRKEIIVKDQKALYGISVRRFDGKGHKLNPPAKVVMVVWFDRSSGQTYEVIFRAVKGDSQSVSLFNRILYSIQ